MFIFTAKFNFNAEDQVGRFLDVDSAGTGELETSLNWLRLDVDPASTTGRINEPAWPLAGFNVHAESWTDLGDAGTLRVDKPDADTSPYPTGQWHDHIIGVYIHPSTAGGGVSLSGTLELAVCFGRPVKVIKQQKAASPFTGEGAGSDGDPVKSTFIFPAVTRNAGPGWFFALGQVAIRPKDEARAPKKKAKYLAHRYEFALGIVVRDAGKTRYYGEDPEMDIGEN